MYYAQCLLGGKRVWVDTLVDSERVTPSWQFKSFYGAFLWGFSGQWFWFARFWVRIWSISGFSPVCEHPDQSFHWRSLLITQSLCFWPPRSFLVWKVSLSLRMKMCRPLLPVWAGSSSSRSSFYWYSTGFPLQGMNSSAHPGEGPSTSCLSL